MYMFSENLFAGQWTPPPISSDPFCGNADPIFLFLLNILRDFSITKSKLRPTLPFGLGVGSTAYNQYEEIYDWWFSLDLACRCVWSCILGQK